MASKFIFILPAVIYVLLIVIAVAEYKPDGRGFPESEPTPGTTSTPTPTPVKPDSDGNNKTEAGVGSSHNDNLREGLKIIAEGSRAISGWALLIIGASIVAIVSTSYLRPLNMKVRLTYLLFIPGWILVGLSTYYGDRISRRYMAAVLTTREDVLSHIFEKVNGDFASQLLYFQRGLLVFSVWLISFLLWWVFGSGSASTNANK